MEDLKLVLQDTIEITRMAGDVIMSYFRSAMSVRDKSPDNPVTDADFAADNLLKKALGQLLPEAGWLSEETVDNPARLNHDYAWVVDPLDGTKEFVKGIPEFSISVGLVAAGKPILGVILNPATDELFTGLRGHGIMLNDAPVAVSQQNSLTGATIDASRSEINRGEFEPFSGAMTVQMMGSIAYKLARVAAGHADATWSRGPKNEWDICAGTLLVLEAGGACVNLDNRDFRFNQPKTKVNGIIANNGALHRGIIETLTPLGAARLV